MSRELAVCWSHARRPLVKGEKNYPEAKRALDLIAALYAVEGEAEGLATDLQSLLEHRRRLRKERSAGLIRDLRAWMDAQQTIPGSQLDKGVQYLRKYEPAVKTPNTASLWITPCYYAAQINAQFS